MSDGEDPKVTIGDRVFVVPEFTIKSQRRITPALMKLAKLGTEVLDTEENFGMLLDVVYLGLTIQGANEITKEEFEELKMRPMVMASEVLPVLLRQAGMAKATPALGDPKGGSAADPQTPLNGATISTI